MSRYQITVEPSGHIFHADADETILAAALRVGVLLPHGCRNGACGSCKGKLLRGQVEHGEHAPAALTDEDLAQDLALLCCAYPRSDLVLELRLAEGIDAMPRKMPARIDRIAWATKDVAILSLKLPESEHLAFRAGQYVDFILPNGLRRSYSIASLPKAGSPIEFHIRHMPGGTFTDALFGLHGQGPAVKERGILRLEGPLGSFFLREDGDEPIVLLASGTGFAPVKAIAETIFLKGLNRNDPISGRRGRQVTLYWGARTRADLYMDELPRRWVLEQENFRYVPVLSEPEGRADEGDSTWDGRTGFVHHAVMDDIADLSDYHVYACGVPIMVQSAHRDFLAQRNLREQNFFSDAFVSRADLAPLAAAQAAANAAADAGAAAHSPR